MLYGTRVMTAQGVKLTGTVVPRIPLSKYSDGSYREPSTRERPVFVEWDDGTKGWLSAGYVVPIGV